MIDNLHGELAGEESPSFSGQTAVRHLQSNIWRVGDLALYGRQGQRNPRKGRLGSALPASWCGLGGIVD